MFLIFQQPLSEADEIFIIGFFIVVGVFILYAIMIKDDDPVIEFVEEEIEEEIEEPKKRSRRISQRVKDQVWRRDEGKCVECGSNENLEFDHIIPHSKGGANTYRNIQLLCEQCNRSKSAKIG
jgi:hypothetical protein